MYQSDRYFRVWDYSVSHDRLLIRSATSEHKHIIDIIFYGVEYMQLRTQYEGISIQYSHIDGYEMVFMINEKDLVHSLQCIVIENDLNFWQSPLEGLDTQDIRKACGHWNELWNSIIHRPK